MTFRAWGEARQNAGIAGSAGSLPQFWYWFDTEYDTFKYGFDTEYSPNGANRPVCQYVLAVVDQTRMKPACLTSKRKYFRDKKLKGSDFTSKMKTKTKNGWLPLKK